MRIKPLIITGAVIAAAAVGGSALTYALSGTESTTRLNQFDTVRTDGAKALSGKIVAGRTASKYGPLPWVGTALSDVQCPDLKAAPDTKVICTAKDGDGKALSIPVTVVKASDTEVTWKFERE